MTLNDAKRGSAIKIKSILDESGRSQLLRMGISEGTVITCYEKLPMGPVIVKCNRQEIALGRKLAASIIIE